MAEEETEAYKPLIIFGRDVRKIPCFRNSYLYGISSGIGMGLLVFMFTSKPRLGSHVAVATFVFVTMTYWTNCRFQWAEQKYSMGQIQGAYKRGLTLKENEERPIVREVEVVEV